MYLYKYEEHYYVIIRKYEVNVKYEITKALYDKLATILKVVEK